ncbi:MAG: efflux RND transporter periplasmic adaptor subunit [Deltaproteobacteria bacterium]|nr:efflux RND transporter periplasmic adaptor subunit [Deltaproteobacteria bacterium]
MKKRIIIIAFFVLLLLVILLVYFGQRSARLNGLFYSGTLEATQAELSFQAAGRVADLPVDEGQSVEQGQVLAVLDQSEYRSRYDQAKANLDAAKADLTRAELSLETYKKTLPADVERYEAGVKALKAQVDQMEAGYRSQDVEKADYNLASLKASMEIALKNKERYDKLFADNIVSEKEHDSATLQYETALKAYEGARANMDQMREGYREEDIRAAKAKLLEGEAILKQAKTNLSRIDMTQKEVEAAGAKVQAAEAAFRLTETQLGYMELKAPFKGTITSRNIEPGEVVSIGQEVFSLADLSSIELKIYVDETEIGNVRPGQDADVTVDTFQDKVFKGKVSFISPEAEFTPKIIQTRKERVKLVYLVKVLIPNPDLDLKPGMPADATLK